MINKQLTNDEILSSLKLISNTANCDNCKIRNVRWGACDCPQITAEAALELINRYKNEIKKLQKEVGLLTISVPRCTRTRTAEVKAEAYKEFAERLKEKYGIFTPLGVNWIEEVKAVRVSDIDNLLKEMIGE